MSRTSSKLGGLISRQWHRLPWWAQLAIGVVVGGIFLAVVFL